MLIQFTFAIYHFTSVHTYCLSHLFYPFYLHHTLITSSILSILDLSSSIPLLTSPHPK
ncbi:hypothetical protein BDQ12DRAFT_684879 [Crucibulum laeve]|uniref:Uncharacterized protein n=1 Tax=Crucibulum laeve TaxID=68775 RepID=A0A5C3LXJ8_9AGAR|nr:hypothetical protein BDQ12DRAFT_684879 [Crucibulum laeve]